MKLIENNEEIIIHDYPWCLFLLGLISGVLGVYIFLQGDKANFFVALILFIVFSGYAKKRIFTLNKRKNIFAYKEKNLFKTKVFSGKASDIETIDIHYGRGRTIIPSGFIVVQLAEGEKFNLNEMGRCLIGKNMNQEVVNKLHMLLN